MIKEITAFFGGRFCRVLSGQRRPELTREDGELPRSYGVINGLLPFAEKNGVVLAIENHYKDNYWQYPESAQRMDVFCEIVAQSTRRTSASITTREHDSRRRKLWSCWRVKHRVVTMHASDRYLKKARSKTCARKRMVGYASRLSHGGIGKGMNDYDKIFSTLNSQGSTRGFRSKMAWAGWMNYGNRSGFSGPR